MREDNGKSAPPWPTDDALRALLAPFVRDTLDGDASTICALTEADRIAYVNPAWKRFGRENGARDDGTWGVGTFLLAAVPLVVRPFHERLFARVRRTHAPADYSYECSSPTTLRRFYTRVFPTQRDGLLLVHSLALETAHPAHPSPAIESLYRDANEFVTQCSNCRRMRRADLPYDQWDWVSEYAQHMLPNTSHGLCAICVAHYYAE